MRSRFMDNHSILGRANLMTNITLVPRWVCVLSFIVVLDPLFFVGLIATNRAGIQVVRANNNVTLIFSSIVTYTIKQGRSCLIFHFIKTRKTELVYIFHLLGKLWCSTMFTMFVCSQSVPGSTVLLTNFTRITRWFNMSGFNVFENVSFHFGCTPTKQAMPLSVIRFLHL